MHIRVDLRLVLAIYDAQRTVFATKRRQHKWFGIQLRRGTKAMNLVVLRCSFVFCAALPLLAAVGREEMASGRLTGPISGHGTIRRSIRLNASNFNKLEVAWRFSTANLGRGRSFQFEGTPLMVKA